VPKTFNSAHTGQGISLADGVGPAPPGGVLSAADRDSITNSRAWRDRVDNLAGATAPQKATLKTDMGIP
jgi:hypothetical protein